jgi:hypothetical protein
VTADAGKAAFEELKRLSAPLVEFVAANQGIPHEIVFRYCLASAMPCGFLRARRPRPCC